MTHRTLIDATERIIGVLGRGELSHDEADLIATFIDGLRAPSGHVRSRTRGGMSIECRWIRDKLDGRR